MSSSQSVAAFPLSGVVPDTTTPKVLGIMNIVLGCLALPCGIYFTLYIAMISFMMPVMMDEANKSQQRFAKASAAAQAAEAPVLSDETKEVQATKIADALKDAKDENVIITSEITDVEIDFDFGAQQATPGGPGLGAAPPDIFGAIFKNGDVRVIAWASSDAIATLLLNVGMIAAGIGLLMRHSWGRTMAIWVAALKIVALIASQAYWAMVCVPSAAAKFGEAISSMPSPGPGANASSVSVGFIAYMTVIAVATVFFCSIYPIICLVLLRMARVKAAFTKKPATVATMAAGPTNDTPAMQ